MAAKVKKRPSSEDVKNLLLEGNFGLSTDDALPLTDPISTTQMVLKLEDIKPYDKNPRRERNPEYEKIKASIRSKKQLNNNFNVTRRPGDDLLMVESGGNTRLSILKELYQETADEAFNNVHCLFVPWTSESSVLTAHLIENEMRGDMMLIDKAYAVQELKRELETEEGEMLSDKKFTQLAAAIGYKLSRTHLIRFNYALELDQTIPFVLRTGIGGHKIDHIKKVEKAYRLYCKDKTELFDAAFMAVMSESNTEDYWDFEQVRLELDDRLSELTGIRYNLLRLEVDAILSNQPNNVAGQVEQYAQQGAEPEKIELQLQSSKPIPSHNQQYESEIKPLSSEESQDNELKDATAHRNSTVPESVEAPLTNKKNTKTTKKDKRPQLIHLRQKGFELAWKIARSADHEEIVIQAKCGYGFFMESPAKPLVLDSNDYFFWWLLFGISEQNVNKESHYPMWAYTDLYSRFGNDQRNQDNSLVNWIGLEPGVTRIISGCLQQQAISDQIFTDVFRLMENCRKIQGNFLDNEIWKQPS
jgi:ParB family protein of integrating conjugative element (PFGI_1 class)